jgi:pimeloyl-ACP methyl ester carboxylesterase
MKRILLLLLVSFSAFAQTEETIVSGNSKLHYRIFGSGKPILFINGEPGIDSNGFTSFAQQMSEKNQIILYDRRGTGRSELAEKIHGAFPNSKLVLIEKCGHYGWLDAPEGYFSAIDQFLKTV